MNILLTGAAGLIGGELAAQLSAAGHGVIGLVRSNKEIRSNDGQHLKTAGYLGQAPANGEILTFAGDISDPDLGLEISQLQRLQQQVDLVIHCAALTAFDASPDQYRAINVNGTGHVQTRFPNARFLYVSTAYVCGSRDGLIPETAHDPGADFVNGYEASKALAETEIIERASRYVIARPSIVVGTHERGTIQRFDTIYAVFRLIAEGNITAIPACDHATLGFVPINHVIGGLMDIVDQWDRAEGKIFHLSPNKATPIDSFVDAIASFEQLDRPKVFSPEQFSSDNLPPFERRLYRRTAAYYASYFQRSPAFVTDNLANLSQRICPPVDKAALQRMIGYCVDRGFIRSER